VIASEAAAGTLSSSKALSFFCQVDEALSGALAKAGIVADDLRVPPRTEVEIKVDRTVKEGDTITVEPGVAFEVLETPGHSDCSLSFHEPGRGILLISDATGYYMPEHECWWPNYFTDYEAYVASMERLAGLGAGILCLSHNGVIRGAAEVKAYFEGAIAATRELHERIVSEARDGRGVREIAEQLGAEVHAKTALLPLDFFQKNCGLLVKNSLRHAGIEVKKPS
jgi:glyoxylase-like metal-dependent hydrolase (beta-lactamase superfamily II)